MIRTWKEKTVSDLFCCECSCVCVFSSIVMRSRHGSALPLTNFWLLRLVRMYCSIFNLLSLHWQCRIEPNSTHNWIYYIILLVGFDRPTKEIQIVKCSLRHPSTPSTFHHFTCAQYIEYLILVIELRMRKERENKRTRKRERENCKMILP